MNQQPRALPWPVAWPRRAGRWMRLNLLFIGALTIGMAGVSAAAWSAGDRGQGLLLAAGAAMCALIIAGVAPLQTARRRRRPEKVAAYATGTGEQGVRIPYSAWWFGWLVTLISATGAIFVAVLWWALLVDGLTDPRNVIGLVLALAAVPYCAWFLLEVVRGRVARGGVVFTPRGLHHRYLVLDEFVPWDSLLSVTAGYERGPTIELGTAPGEAQRRQTSGVALRRAPLSGSVKVYGRPLAVDPAVVYHAVAYYRARPQARAELATDAGLQRIRTGDLLAG